MSGWSVANLLRETGALNLLAKVLAGHLHDHAHLLQA
jgi:hypothetical protein